MKIQSNVTSLREVLTNYNFNLVQCNPYTLLVSAPTDYGHRPRRIFTALARVTVDFRATGFYLFNFDSKLSVVNPGLPTDGLRKLFLNPPAWDSNPDFIKSKVNSNLI